MSIVQFSDVSLLFFFVISGVSDLLADDCRKSFGISLSPDGLVVDHACISGANIS